MVYHLILGPDDEAKKKFLKTFFDIEEYPPDKILRLKLNQDDDLYFAPFLTTFSDFNKIYIKHAAKAIIFGEFAWTLDNLQERNANVQVLHRGNSNLSETEIQVFMNLNQNELSKKFFVEMLMEI